MNCTKKGIAGSIVYIACEECGHGMCFHPGVLNPSLKVCALCMLDKVIQIEVTQRNDSYHSYEDKR